MNEVTTNPTDSTLTETAKELIENGFRRNLSLHWQHMDQGKDKERFKHNVVRLVKKYYPDIAWDEISELFQRYMILHRLVNVANSTITLPESPTKLRVSLRTDINGIIMVTIGSLKHDGYTITLSNSPITKEQYHSENKFRATEENLRREKRELFNIGFQKGAAISSRYLHPCLLMDLISSVDKHFLKYDIKIANESPIAFIEGLGANVFGVDFFGCAYYNRGASCLSLNAVVTLSEKVYRRIDV